MTTDDAEKQKASNRKRAWRLFRWSSRANWLAFLFKTKGEVAVAIASAALVAGVGGATIRDAMLSREKIRTPATTQQLNESTVAFPVAGFDESGRRAEFEILVLTRNIGWAHKSTTELVKDGVLLTALDVQRAVLTTEVQTRLKAAEQVIAVGTASQEGEIAEETHRAGRRAQQAAAWALPSIPAKTPLWTLNLGQYRDPCTDCETGNTSWQRPFILIAVLRTDQGADLAQALASALSDRTNLPPPSAYSTFGLARFR